MQALIKIKHAIGFGLLVAFALPATAVDDIPIYRLGTAAPGNVYHDFARKLIKRLNKQNTPFRLRAVPTEGSLDNLERIEQGEIELAIVQNDVAFNVYEGRHGYPPFQGFSALLPLFAEYVQVLVRRDSTIRILGDLENKTIFLGPELSGSYHNALNLMREIGFRPGIDFEPVYLPINKAMQQLIAGRIDAIIYTGATLPDELSDNYQNLRSIPISSEIAASLRTQSSYYMPAEMNFPGNPYREKIPTVAVRAYLVASNRLETRQTEQLIDAIATIWPQLASTSGYQLGTFEEIIRRSPIPIHPGMKRFLSKKGYLESGYREYLVFFAIVLTILALVYWAHRTTSGYDRLGNIRAKDGVWHYRIALQISRISIFILIVLIFVVITIALVFAIRYVEMDYARQMDIDNEFANVNFSDAMLWMFMFMGAGEPGDIFPLSTAGKILATILPFLGITSVLGFFFTTVERRRRLAAERKRGTVTRNVRNHVLICGWNEKVPGLVYALTNKEVPERKKVVIVAELEGEMPLEHYCFDPIRVSYCRGDSADRGALERAHVGAADMAIVVADLRKRDGRNIRSVLTVMALKEAYRKARGIKAGTDHELFVAAEMIYDENQALFDACEADALVPSEMLADRMASICCISPIVADYVLDMFTYDDHAELYSISVDRIRPGLVTTLRTTLPRWRWLRGMLSGKGEKKGNVKPGESMLTGMTLRKVQQMFSCTGVNVIGVVRGYKRDKVLIDHEFDATSPYRLMLTTEGGELRIEPGDSLLYIADDHDNIHAVAHIEHHLPIPAQSSSSAHDIQLQERRQVLMVGELQRCLRVRRLLEHAPNTKVQILTEDTTTKEQKAVVSGPIRDRESWLQAGLKQADVVLILADTDSMGSYSSLLTDQGKVDAMAIFAARFARRFRAQESGDSLQIVAEMVNSNNRSLFKDAGVDVVIPRTLWVERVLTKLVYSRGVVCDFLMALLSLKDQIHLHSFTLDEKRNPELLGKTFGELMILLPEGIQLMGLLPGGGEERERLLNRQGDFDYHFLGHPEQARKNPYRTRSGDELVVIVDRRLLSG